jgi:predicted TIM-barrel fold metal-dependent hydrolase
MSSASLAEAREAPPAFDCDVHVPVPTVGELSRHLSEQWADYLRWTNFRSTGGVPFNFPAWAPMFAPRSGEDAYAALQERVLSRVDRAILTCYSGVEGVSNPYLAAAMAAAVNAYLAGWLDRDPRLLALAAITPQNTEQAVREVYRIAADRRFVGVLVPARTGEPYGNQRYWPIWDAVAEHGLVIGLTYGGVPAVRYTPSFFDDYVLVAQAFQTQISSLVMSGVFDRLPDLRVTVSESGWTWLPSLLWRMDQEWKAYATEVPWVREPPSAYVRRHFRFTTNPVDAPDPGVVAETLDQIGGTSGSGHELLLHGSDHPHVHEADHVWSCLTANQRERMLRENPGAWYRTVEEQS